jgi:hypothetical protein
MFPLSNVIGKRIDVLIEANSDGQKISELSRHPRVIIRGTGGISFVEEHLFSVQERKETNFDSLMHHGVSRGQSICNAELMMSRENNLKIS